MIRILFVDDEPNILQGLQRMLRPMRHVWEMAFAGSGAEALAMLAEQPFDIVITDMRMQRMNGAQLLTSVASLYPQTARVILSGQSEEEAILRSVGPAHQYLSKPCSAEMLQGVVERIACLQNLLSNADLQRMVSEIKSLPVLPAVYLELVEVLQQPETSLDRIGAIVGKDIGVTAKLLQLVNSAFLGLARDIKTPEQAVSYIGINTVRSLVLTIHVFSQFDQQRTPHLTLTTLWTHCIRVGTLSKQIAQIEGLDRSEQENAYTAGLLHDIGKLILATGLPDLYQQMFQQMQARKQSQYEAEREVFGATHAEVGAYLMGLWGLPNSVVEAIAFHHMPEQLPGSQFCALSAVYAADHIVNALYAPETMPGKLEESPYLVSLERACRVPLWRTAGEKLC